MFTRTSKYLKAAIDAASASTAARMAIGNSEALERHNAALDKEVRRLTDIIIRMKQEGFGTHTEESTWGSYTFDEIENDRPARARRNPEPEPEGFGDEDVARAEEEIRRELEVVMGEI